MSDIIGFDVSIAKTGWAVLDFESGELVWCGTIESTPADNLYERLKFLACSTQEVLEENLTSNKFDAALEGGFSARSGEITRKLAMAWITVAMTIYDFAHIEPAIVAPTSAKKLATGKGNCKKPEVQAAAVAKWGEDVDDSDIADACWIAEFNRLAMLEHLDV